MQCIEQCEHRKRDASTESTTHTYAAQNDYHVSTQVHFDFDIASFWLDSNLLFITIYRYHWTRFLSPMTSETCSTFSLVVIRSAILLFQKAIKAAAPNEQACSSGIHQNLWYMYSHSYQTSRQLYV